MPTKLSPGHWFCVRFALIALAALALLVGASLACSVLLARWHGGNWLEPNNLWVGLACGLIAWLFVAVFHLRKETSTLVVDNHEQFMGNAQQLLSEMGYEVTAQRNDFLDTRPGFHAMLFGAGVQVAIQASHARITGPKISIEKLRTNLRMYQQLSRVHQVLGSRTADDAKLKRVELKLRVTPEQLTLVQSRVLAPLARESSVVCDIYVLAQSNEGIRECVVDSQIRDWIHQQDIPCEIHKDFIKIVELARDDTLPAPLETTVPLESAFETCEERPLEVSQTTK